MLKDINDFIDASSERSSSIIYESFQANEDPLGANDDPTPTPEPDPPVEGDMPVDGAFIGDMDPDPVPEPVPGELGGEIVEGDIDFDGNCGINPGEDFNPDDIFGDTSDLL